MTQKCRDAPHILSALRVKQTKRDAKQTNGWILEFTMLILLNDDVTWVIHFSQFINKQIGH